MTSPDPMRWLDDVIAIRLAAIALDTQRFPVWARNLREIADRIERESLDQEADHVAG